MHETRLVHIVFSHVVLADLRGRAAGVVEMTRFRLQRGSPGSGVADWESRRASLRRRGVRTQTTGELTGRASARGRPSAPRAATRGTCRGSPAPPPTPGRSGTPEPPLPPPSAMGLGQTLLKAVSHDPAAQIVGVEEDPDLSLRPSPPFYGSSRGLPRLHTRRGA